MIQYKFHSNTIKWKQRFRNGIGLTFEQQRSIAENAWKIWSNVCGIQPRYAETNFDVLIDWSSRLGNVLASSIKNTQVPVIRSSKVLLSSTKTTWTASELLRALVHEFGHAIGLDHSDDPAGIMYKKYSNNIVPSSGERSAAVAAYGNPTDPPVPSEPPTEAEQMTAAELQRRYGFRPSEGTGFAFNSRGYREKYLRAASDHADNPKGWFLILPDGQLLAWRGGTTSGLRTIDSSTTVEIGKLTSWYYYDPNRLIQADDQQPDGDTPVPQSITVSVNVPGSGTYSGELNLG